MNHEIVILGTRGSVPVSGSNFARYGGGTTCVFLRMGEQVIVLDAGTGMLDLPDCLRKDDRHITLLLSHPHLDHLLGFPMCRAVSDPEKIIDVYAVSRDGMDTRAQLSAFMRPPLWPIGPELLSARINFLELPSVCTVGAVEIRTMEGIHPGGVTLFRLTVEGKSVVFVTDCTLTEKILPDLVAFAQGCDLLLCDGQYSEPEWAGRENFGHNTWVSAARLGAACGAATVRILHHDPSRTDAELDSASPELLEIHPDCRFAKAGERLLL